MLRRIALFLLFLLPLAAARAQVTDALSSPGAMGPKWTCTSSAGATLTTSAGVITASGSQWAECYWSADKFTNFGLNDQISIWKTPPAGSNYASSGPGVRMKGSGIGSGTGYVWQLGSRGISVYHNGYVGAGIGAGRSESCARWCMGVCVLQRARHTGHLLRAQPR